MALGLKGELEFCWKSETAKSETRRSCDGETDWGKKKISKNVFYLVCSADLRTKEIHTMWKLYVDLHTPILRFYSCEGFYLILTKVYAKQSLLRVYFKTNCHSLYIYHVTT